MKRKLCVAIALIGESKVILLDEPTAGMDPISRRDVCAVLEKAKQSRLSIKKICFLLNIYVCISLFFFNI